MSPRQKVRSPSIPTSGKSLPRPHTDMHTFVDPLCWSSPEVPTPFRPHRTAGPLEARSKRQPCQRAQSRKFPGAWSILHKRAHGNGRSIGAVPFDCSSTPGCPASPSLGINSSASSCMSSCSTSSVMVSTVSPPIAPPEASGVDC